jgi:hypothetical protein
MDIEICRGPIKQENSLPPEEVRDTQRVEELKRKDDDDLFRDVFQIISNNPSSLAKILTELNDSYKISQVKDCLATVCSLLKTS